MVGIQLQQLVRNTAIALVVLTLAACGSKEKAGSGQSLVRVDGQEITQSQLNTELAQANVPAQQRDAASKKLLSSLIDRQLLQEQAAKDKIDRDPSVVAAIERAKAQIIAQAYIQHRLANVARPTKEEIDKYYMDHPDFFADRKVYEFDQVIFASKNFGPELKATMNANKSLNDITGWLKEHHIEYVQNAGTNNSVDLPPALVQRLKTLRTGQIFALQQSDNTVIAAIKIVKEAPIKQDVAEPQIAAFMQKQRNGEAAEAEMSRLRTAAKIEYLNKKVADATPSGKSGAASTTSGTPDTSTTLPADDAAKKKDSSDDHTKRGVADL